MRGKLVYPYTDKLLQYEFLKEHPLKPDRLKLTYLLSEQLGLLEHVKQIETEVVSREELEMLGIVEDSKEGSVVIDPHEVTIN
ncbi:MAG: hypothetical protein ACTSU3_06200 [Candidatus Thorarchaeota archaeon]